MKKLFLLIFVCSYFQGLSQIEFGVKTGLSSLELATKEIIVQDANDSYGLKYKNARYGFHFGLYNRIKFLGVYVESSALINSSSVNYSFRDLSEVGAISVVKNETFTGLDIPVLLGYKIGMFRLQAGPVAHIVLSSGSDLFELSGYEQKFDQAKFGFQTGLGLDIWKLRCDLLYENNFSKFGDHITLAGNEYAFDKRAARLIGNISYKF